MTHEEAIKYGKEQYDVFGGRMVEFLDLSINALEKQIPKKPHITIFNGYCPNCKEAFGKSNVEEAMFYPKYHRYCPMCGQAIDWSDEE